MSNSTTTQQASFLADQKFFTRMALIMIAVIFVGFIQFSLRGLVDWSGAYAGVYIHGFLMLAWLILLAGQNVLIQNRNFALHRKLGWLAVPIVVGVLPTGFYTGYMAVLLDRVPPFFSDPYFLALTFIQTSVFGVMVLRGVAWRKQTQWHRRLMMGATFIVLEPAFGRLLPMPIIGQQGGWLIVLIQLGFVAWMGAHDRKTLGSVHPATIIAGFLLIIVHSIVQLLAITPAWQAVATSIVRTG